MSACAQVMRADDASTTLEKGESRGAISFLACCIPRLDIGGLGSRKDVAMLRKVVMFVEQFSV